MRLGRTSFALALSATTLLFGCRAEREVLTDVSRPSREGQDFWETGVRAGVSDLPIHSTDAAVTAADLIVVARVVRIAPGSTPAAGRATLEVGRSLRGGEAGEITLEFGLGRFAEQVGQLQQRLPSGRGIYLLRRRGGPSYRLISPAGIVIEVDGRARFPLAMPGGAGFTSSLTGKPFNAVVGALLRAISNSGREGLLPAPGTPKRGARRRRYERI